MDGDGVFGIFFDEGEENFFGIFLIGGDLAEVVVAGAGK